MHIASISIYRTDLKDKIIAAENLDQQYLKIKETLKQGNLLSKFNYYEWKEDGIIMYRGKVFVSNSTEMRNIVMREMYNVPYARCYPPPHAKGN